MTRLTRIDPSKVRDIVSKSPVDIRTASIREVNNLVNAIEREMQVRFVRMEFGIPGLPAPGLAVEAELEALRDRKLAGVYAPFEGVPALKEETARFVKLFMDFDVPAASCVPTVGAMQGCFASIAVASHLRAGRSKMIFLQPGFPVNRQQARLLDVGVESIDFYDHRGEDLVHALEQRARSGEYCAVLWSSPNNPSWICLTDAELRGIGRVCDEHGMIAIEDLAYFGMDVREDYYEPGRPPYQPTILRHCANSVSIISSSKMFSYAGQRIAMTVIHPDLLNSDRPELVERFGTGNFGHAFIHGTLYPMTASVAEGPQHGLLALLRAANSGDRSVFRPAAEYARRAAIMKRLFVDSGFRLVYDNDLRQPLADGFYFTIAHPDFDDGVALLGELLCYGVSAITLETTGSCRREGLRACVSMVGDSELEMLKQRLQYFREDHPA